MCFSASASLTAGAALTGLGAATIPFVRDRRQLPFAALPLVFGLHQLLEGLIWMQLDDAGGATLRTPAVVAWLLIAWTALPIYVPLAISLFEPDRRRRRAMHALAAVGVGIGLYLLIASAALGATVHVNGHHLQYAIPVHPGWVLGVPYVLATCLSPLLSSHRFVVIFGIALTLSLAVTTAMNAIELSSVWCFFAAVLSVGILTHYLAESSGRRWPTRDIATAPG